ncbi:hypothetical protein COCON_G00187930 [Conger conger]|uniref:Cell adhesion molecule-related/down-regulated by oncogenes n=1 Tax=Conger conger TaxID=82655 RepID=A0A9Q1D2J3_CONCO|nr:hypothetical protein COCON_G00187930 [Conger conger]
MDARPGVLSTLLYLCQACLVSCSHMSMHITDIHVYICMIHVYLFLHVDVADSGRAPQRSLSVEEGSTALIQCPLPLSHPPALPRVRVRGEWLDKSTGEYLILPSGNLQIVSVSPQHQGMYKCGAYNPVTQETNVEARGTMLIVKRSDTPSPVRMVYPTTPQTVVVAISQSATLECVLGGSPTPIARWTKDGQEVAVGSNHRLLHNNLVLTAARESDGGDYQCSAPSETGGWVHANYTVSVLAVSEQASPGSSVTFTCTVTGNPAPNITWLFNSAPLTPSPRLEISGSSLQIAAVMQQEEGVYQCLADNGIGSAQSAGALTVQSERLVKAPEAPIITSPPQTQKPHVYDLEWRAGRDWGSPINAYFVRYRKLDDVGNVAGSWHTVRVPGSEKALQLADLEPSSLYEVLMVARTAAGEGQPAMLTFRTAKGVQDSQDTPVEGKSDTPTPEAPIITSPPQTQKPHVYDLEWRAGRDWGSPINAYFVRYRKLDDVGNVAGSWHTVRVPGSEKALQLADLEPSSLYEVLMVARTAAGEGQPAMLTFRTAKVPVVSATLTMTVKAPPPPSVNPIQRDEGEGLFSEEDELGFSQDTPVEGKSDTPTPEAPIITSPPQTQKPHVYDLEWRAGRDWGSPINAYFVRYRKLDDVGNVAGSWHTVRVPGSEKALQLADLEPSSLYEVLMVARTAAGEGQPAMLTFRTAKEKSTSSGKNDSKAPFLFQPEKVPENENTNTHFGVVIPDRVPEAPDRPTISMATESSVYVTWIPRANGGSPITAFRVEYRRQTRNADWAVAADNISPLKLSVEVRTLEPGSAYRFRVVALNAYGESPHSAPSRPYGVSPAGPPFSSRPVAGPHITSTDAVSDSQIMLRWTYTPSSNNNTPIQGFYIYYRPTDSDNDSDYKRDVVEGSKHWHLIGQLQPETSYDIKMQCFNDGGESEYSNVMICETKVRQAPGVPREHPITPPGPYPPDPPAQAGGLLYLIVGSVLGVMMLILLVFIGMCLWRNRQQSGPHKYDTPGYLYQPAEMNGHVLEYSTLPGTARINGYSHTGSPPPSSCPHLHHKLPNGTMLPNGTGHDGPLEYEHLPHNPHNGGGMYTALPQSDSSDCMSCQNFCNNNRCYAKANGTFSSGSLPMMHRAAPCQQDTLEMVPLGHVTSQSQGSEGHPLGGDEGGGKAGEEEEEPGSKTPPHSQHSCCQSGDHQCCSLEERDGEELLFEEDPDGLGVCWETLVLPELDCKEKTAWISNGSMTGGLIQPQLQEI